MRNLLDDPACLCWTQNRVDLQLRVVMVTCAMEMIGSNLSKTILVWGAEKRERVTEGVKALQGRDLF